MTDNDKATASEVSGSDMAREAFEDYMVIIHHCTEDHLSVDPENDDRYFDCNIDLVWSAWQHQQGIIESQSRTITELEAIITNKDFVLDELRKQASEAIGNSAYVVRQLQEELTRIAEKVGVCGAGKCSADMWADPPRDCSAPDCLDIDKGIDQLQDRVKELDREIDILRLYGNKDCTAMADEAIKKIREPKP